MASNVLGTTLESCCMDPVTGFYRNGKCDIGKDDIGMHSVCVEINDEFLQFAKDGGNDLITPMPEYNFPGLKEGDYWCVCVGTVVEALKAGIDFRIKLKATHISVKEFIDIEDLKSISVESLA